MIQKGDLYYPGKDFKKNAFINTSLIYEEAKKSPIRFWQKASSGIIWKKKFTKVFSHKPPYAEWFLNGKLNITESCLDRNVSDKPALIWEPESITEPNRILSYKELLSEVNKLANALLKLGISKGDRVAIYLPMIPEAIISMLAIARIGAVHTVIFSAFSPAALGLRIKDTGAKLLITADGYFRRGEVVELKNKADEAIKDTGVKKMIVVRRSKKDIPWDREKDIWYHDLISAERDVCRPVYVDSKDPLFILCESGTTGDYLQIVQAAGGYAVQANWTGKAVFDFKPNDTLWCIADIGWVTGHTYNCYASLMNGITLVLYEGAPDFPDKERVYQILEKHKVSIFYTAPTLLRMLEAFNPTSPVKYDLSNLRLLGSVGEKLDEKSWHFLFEKIGQKKCPIIDTWWQTETGAVTICSLPGVGPFKPSFVGRPLPGVNADILDENGKSCKPFKEGSLVLLPPFVPGLLSGIYNDEKKYVDTYWSRYGTGIYFTSDSAFKDKKGLVRITGRADDVLKVAGHRIGTGELETAILHNSFVSEVAVVGVPDEIKGEVPLVFAVMKERREEIVTEQIRKEIGPIALPKKVYLVRELPKTRSGKTMRKLLKSLILKSDPGDLSTLSNPETVEEIKKLIEE